MNQRFYFFFLLISLMHGLSAIGCKYSGAANVSCCTKLVATLLQMRHAFASSKNAGLVNVKI